MYYWVYGFALKSDFELPELREITREEAEAGPPPMVEIVNGPVPEALPGERRLAPWFSCSGNTGLFSIPTIGRIFVESGCRITVEMRPAARESDMRTYLLGSGLGAIVHQRKMIPLHVSVVLGPKGAIAFTGPSGAGKSTLAKSLNAERGWPMIADDVAVMRVTEAGVSVEGGVYRTRLWSDALERFGIPREGLTRDLYREEKYQFFERGLFVGGVRSLSALVELSPESGIRSEILKNADSFSCLVNAIYRPTLLRLFGDERSAVATITHACNSVKILRSGSYKEDGAQSILESAL